MATNCGFWVEFRNFVKFLINVKKYDILSPNDLGLNMF